MDYFDLHFILAELLDCCPDGLDAPTDVSFENENQLFDVAGAYLIE